MSFPKFEDCKTEVNNRDLDEVEARLGIVLPSDLRQHYLKYNGGSPVPSFYKSGDNYYWVRGFLPIKYGITDDPELTLEAYYADLVLDDPRIPEGLIPFADDPGGNMYCYGIGKANMHSISFWEHEFFDDPDQGLTVIASSLHEFLNGFERHPEDED